ncbi:MAG: sugar transferase [Acidimicrobiia bacterium]|nr:sugar transferase [Acidimicrobiia bacterium]
MEAFARRRRVAKRQRQAEAAATSWHAVAHRPPRPDGSPLPGSQPLTLLLIVADSAGLAFGYITGVLLANAWDREVGHPFAWCMAFVAITVLVFMWRDQYSRRVTLDAVAEVPATASALAIAALVFGTAGLVANRSSRAAIAGIFACGLSVVVVPVMRSVVYAWERRRRCRGAQRNIAILGMGDVALELAERIDANPDLGMRVVLFFDREGPPDGGPLATRDQVRDDDLVPLLKSHSVDQVIVAFTRSGDDEVLDMVRRTDLDVDVAIVPRLFDVTTPKLRVDEVSRIPFVTMPKRTCHGISAVAKRLVDVVVAVVGLVALAPLLGLVALLIRLDSPGPVLFRQRRVGRGGTTFDMLKFRTMCDGAESLVDDLRGLSDVDSILFKMRRDPRVTRVGRHLRRFSIDELPQLWNVLVGQMSVVGPRPPLPSEVAEYPVWFHKRQSVRPGITGLWQVRGRSDLDFDESTRLDLYYVEHWSPWLDVEIALRTVGVVLFGRGAY